MGSSWSLVDITECATEVVTNNVFTSNSVTWPGKGVLYANYLGSESQITGNTFTDNITASTGDESVILLSAHNQSIINCTGNTFLNPDFAYEVKADSPYHSSAYVIDCSGSWWGTTTEMEILDRIYDYYDDNTLMIVEHYPWATAPLP